MENNLKSCAENNFTNKATNKVGSSLDNLYDMVALFGKLSKEVIDLIQSPKPTQCSPEGQSGIQTNQLTLSQQIDRVADRVADSNQRLALAIDIIKQNLGEIKLD